jgi:hypothetical protein
MMPGKYKFVAVAVAVGMIPAAIAVYESFLAPATAGGGVVIAPGLWYSLCAFTPALLPLLSVLEGHHWLGPVTFALLLFASNALVYGLCGWALAFLMKKAGRARQLHPAQPRTSH